MDIKINNAIIKLPTLESQNIILEKITIKNSILLRGLYLYIFKAGMVLKIKIAKAIELPDTKFPWDKYLANFCEEEVSNKIPCNK